MVKNMQKKVEQTNKFYNRRANYENRKYYKDIQRNPPRVSNYDKNGNILSCIWKRFVHTIISFWIQSNYSTCGFPSSGLSKVLSKLEELEVSYIILNKAENYEVVEEEDFKSKNKYNEMYNKAYGYVSKKNRIDSIYQFLLESISEEKIKEKIVRIEEIIYEAS